VASPTTDLCPRCGIEADPALAYCDECGEQLTGESAPHPAGSLAAPPPPPMNEAPSTNGASATSEVSRPAPAPPAQRPPVPNAPRSPLPAIDDYRARLHDIFGFPDLRDGQSDVLTALGHSDVLAVMPTGSGKSICYVLPALEVGRTVVVSPLIALMQDQVESLEAVGISATFINSNLDRPEQNRRYQSFINGQTQLLYVAPERFVNAAFTTGLARAGVELFAVDEAHCISEWGHNFRPDYLQLGEIRERLGQPRTLALTATANPQVRRDIAQRLGIERSAREVVTTIDRPNLTFQVVPFAGMPERRAWLNDYAREHRGQSGIVYARTRRVVEELAETLQHAGLKAEAYHAGLGRELRSAVQRRFTVGETPIIVATNAFGMGIDKPDVRFVVHVNMPGRIEAYYQEAGRAGRDGDPAECTLLYARRDRSSQQRFIDQAHPDDETVRDTWQRWIELADQTDRLPYGLGAANPEPFALIVSALRDSNLLDPVELRLRSRDPLAPIDTTAVSNHRNYAEARLREMTEYAETGTCRRALILRYFGEQPPPECGACDRCLGTTIEGDADYPDQLYDTLIEMRDRIARTTNRDPFRVFENRTARELATYRPRSREDLLQIWGIGERRVDWLGPELLAAVEQWSDANPDAAPPRLPEAAATQRPLKARADFGPDVDPDDPLIEALRAWRSTRARTDGTPAYTLFSDRTLRELVGSRPSSRAALLETWGLGESRVDRFGDEILEVIAAHQPAHP
jgi:ATP-dependent DNA helicase RecQ